MVHILIQMKTSSLTSFLITNFSHYPPIYANTLEVASSLEAVFDQNFVCSNNVYFVSPASKLRRFSEIL
jgi:hypothetical protein